MSDSHVRNLRHLPQSEEPVRRGRNIIAVIGIDKYEQLPLLHNAVSDATGVRSLFVDQLGFKELEPPLYNEQATRDAINSMIVDQLGNQLEPDDSLVLFFAGHGHAEKRVIGDKPTQIGYLIPVEGASLNQRKFSTYLRLDALLKEVANLPAKHILVILDACHSGFALGESVQVTRGEAQRYNDDLSKRMSRRVITSAMSDQLALDNGPVIGHSLFTGTMVEALANSKADSDNKGFVTSSEMALYIQKQVATWSNSQQTPDFGSFELDNRGELVISLVGETQSRLLALESLEIADHVFELGWLTGDSKRFAFAAKQYREALRHALLGKIELRMAELGLGRALLAAGEIEEAIKVLSELANRIAELDDAHFHLGLAHAKRRDYEAAASRLSAWYTANPEHEDAAWIADYVEWLQSAANSPMGRRRALLIGINEYQAPNTGPLRGCVNDVKHLIQPLLLQRFNFAQDDIQLLIDNAATYEGIIKAFAALKQQSLPGDTVLIYYSGLSIPSSQPIVDTPVGEGDNQDAFLLLHDTQNEDSTWINSMNTLELHRLMMEMPATHKTLILDTLYNQSLLDHTENEGDYHFIIASDSGEMAYESSIQIDEREYPCGMLSMALYKSLASLPITQTVTYNDWMNRATQITQEASLEAGQARQTPLFIGERTELVFGRYDPYLFAFGFSQRQRWAETSLTQLVGKYNRYQAFIKTPLPRVAEAFGHAFDKEGAYEHAIAALQLAQDQSKGQKPIILRMLAFAETKAGDFQAAHNHLKQYLLQAPPSEQEGVATMLEHIQKMTGTRRKVTIFLKDITAREFQAGKRPEVEQHLTALQNVLQEKYDDGYEMNIIYQEKAQEMDILDKLEEIAQDGNFPALVYIVGGGHKRADTRESSKKFFAQCREIAQGKAIFLWIQENPRK